jgi:hypothetical protein
MGWNDYQVLLLRHLSRLPAQLNGAFSFGLALLRDTESQKSGET